ncbi:hypothetical protein ACHAWU_004623 [Discostella pseudostelligera]|uniref:Uncharacterized protein n=1 Tax=Discostella pseudostelligera TaxID=259834 RepID=A0ABD3MDQ8_9STRA
MISSNHSRIMSANNKSQRRRMRSRSGRGKTLILSISTLIIADNISPVSRLAYATKNFCGLDWGDASSDCESNQPCPTGIDDECTAGGTCWADTSCDTSLGHGALYNHEDPSHMRFCGTTYNEAMETCSVDNHCPTGDHAECPEGQACFSFLTGCNYVDMMGGVGNITISGGNSTTPKLDADDPARSNYCGTDWNDAISNCDNIDHWCASGADSDCPEGKTCFAGTDCKYEADLFPTVTPTSLAPSLSPTMYFSPTNLRFCGVGWEDAGQYCRIASHCPSGEDTECPEGQACFDSPSLGCNIVDFKQYLAANGTEIFGSDHELLTEGSIPGHLTSSTPSAIPMPTPSALPIPTSSDLPTTLPMTTTSELPTPVVTLELSTTKESSSSITPELSVAETLVPTPSPFQTNSHVFCGKTWQDASDRCSPETFCSEGAALHKCTDPAEFCWVGVTACDASEWITEGTVSPSGEDTTSGTTSPSSSLTSPQTLESSFAVSSSETISTSSEEEDAAEEEESSVIPCNQDQPCPSGYICSSNIICIKEATPEPVPTPIPDETSPPSSLAELSSTPTTIASSNTDEEGMSLSPSANELSSSPISNTLSEDEIAQRLANENNYCATSLSEVMSSCSFTLQTCNDGDPMCEEGTYCFENILCTDSQVSTETSLMPASTTSSSPTPVSTSSGSDEGNNTTTTAQKKCASSLNELLLTCDTAPTCSDSECPGGMFCFSELICAGASSGESSTNGPTSIASSIIVPANPSPSSIPTSLSSSTSSTTIPCGSPQNYCATSRDELQSTCATAQTCNDNDAPCPSGSFCFPEVICECMEDTQPTLTFNSTLPTKMPTQVTNIDTNDQNAVTVIATTDDPCNNLCLQPLDIADCEYALTFPNIMPCTGFPSLVQVGDLCTGTGECGTSLELDTCSNTLDFYWRVEPQRCIEYGLTNGTGVILSSNTEIGADGMNLNPTITESDADEMNLNPTMTESDADGMKPEPTFNFSLANFSPAPSSSNSAADGMPQNGTLNFSQGNFSKDGQTNHGALKGSSSENTTSAFTGWWVLESSSAMIVFSDWMRLMTVLGLVFWL